MLNVMIVDDEPVIRFGLKASVNWEQEGLQLIGDFPNGQEALQAMTDNHVDILITDIKMPIMDGLTLMKQALQIFPKLKVVLVSSYNDFEYVREGLTYGAIDYVMKPTLEPEEFVVLIRKCVTKVYEEQKIEEKLSAINETDQIIRRKEVEQEIKRLILQEEEVQGENIDSCMKAPFLMVLMKIKDVHKIKEKYGDLYPSLILDEVQEIFYNKSQEDVCLRIGEIDLLFVMKEVKSPLDIISSLKERFEQRTALQFYFSYVPIETTQLIKEGFKRCHAAVSSRFFLPDDNIFSYKESQYKIIERLPPEQIRKEITVQYDYNLKGFIEDRLKIWVKEEFPPEYIKSEACDILTSLFGEKIELPCIFDKCVYLKQAETLDQLYERLLIKIEECEGIMSTEFDRSLGDNELLDKAIEYIHEHYTQELTLKHVADHIHISRNYFSILFKKYLQQNFIDYVIELRIKKAKQLLQNSRLKVYEVADQSGFKDVKYFSKLFKRITGYSPGDYRSKRGK